MTSTRLAGHTDIVASSNVEQRTLSLFVEGDKFIGLHALLNKALTTNENPPQWALDLADLMDTIPVPAKGVRATE